MQREGRGPCVIVMVVEADDDDGEDVGVAWLVVRGCSCGGDSLPVGMKIRGRKEKE